MRTTVRRVLDYGQNRLRLGISLVIVLCLAFVAGFGLYRLRSDLQMRDAAVGEVRVFWEAWGHVERAFFGELPSPDVRAYGAIRRSLTLLDPYTVFVEPVDRELEQARLRGAYGGIGATLRRSPDGDIILAPQPNSPAAQAGLITGDVLQAIDGLPLGEADTVDAVAARLRGEIGTSVHLTVERPSGPSFDVTLEREKIEVPSVTWRMETPNIGYVQLSGFSERTDDELTDALEGLRQAGAMGLVLDLRDNRGGLLESAVAVAGRFLRRGDVVLYQAGRVDERRFAVEGSGDLAMPMIVLVNGGTASAAEIVAGAFQDHGRALLLGQPTFGKGSVQEIYDLSDGSSLHVTTAIWMTPDRHRIDNRGLTPDVLVPAGDGLGDEPLSQAVDYLELE